MSIDQHQSIDAANTTLLESMRMARRDQAIAAWVMQEYAKAKNDRAYTERQWYMNLAFYFGKHYVQFVSSTGTNNFQLRTPSAPPWRVRMVINKLRPIVRHEISRLTSSKPTFTVIPATTEDEDQAAARVGEQIFEAAYNEKKINRVLRQAVWWASITGTGILKSYWDDSILVDPGIPGKTMPTTGDIVIERVQPFNIFVPNLDEEDLQKQPFLMHVTTKSPEFIKANYGLESLPTVKAEIPIQDSFLNLIGAKNSLREEVVIIETWIKPGGHKEYPNGGLVTTVGGKVIQNIDHFPYAHREYPFYKIDIVPTGKFYADSNLTDLIPLQKEYNRTKSQIVEAKNLMAKPQLMAPRGSVNPRQISSEPGQVILYTPGLNPPTPLPLQSLPPYVLQELDRLQQDMDDISGQHEITRGNTPAQVTAATAISYLQEQDDTKLAYAVSSIEDVLQDLGRHYLKYVTQFWNSERLVRVVGRDGAFEANHWAGSSLKGNTDIRVQAGSALPQSKAAKQAFVMDLLKLGVIPPEQALDILDIGGIEKVYEDYLVDKRQAERENLKMASLDPMLAVKLVSPPMDPATGQPQMDPTTQQPVQPPPVMPANTWDSHQAHIMVHNRFRKTQQFELLADPIKAIFEQHVMLHQMSLQAVTPTFPTGQQGPALIPGGGLAPQAPQDPNQQQPQQQPPQQGGQPNG